MIRNKRDLEIGHESNSQINPICSVRSQCLTMLTLSDNLLSQLFHLLHKFSQFTWERRVYWDGR